MSTRRVGLRWTCDAISYNDEMLEMMRCDEKGLDKRCALEAVG